MSDTPETNSIEWHDNEWDLKARFEKLERERDEAIRSRHIWQNGHSALVEDRNRWMSLAGVRREDYLQATTLVNELNKELATVRKQNNERLTLLQEHGLAEYGN